MEYATIMTMMLYIKSEYWKIKNYDLKEIKEDQVLKIFNELYDNELTKELKNYHGTRDIKYKGFGFVLLSASKEDNSFYLSDQSNYLSSIYKGIYESFDNRFLAINLDISNNVNHRFSFIEKEDNDHVFLKEIDQKKFNNISIIRLINVLFNTFEPYFLAEDAKKKIEELTK